jgi:hypothetical protein
MFKIAIGIPSHSGAMYLKTDEHARNLLSPEINLFLILKGKSLKNFNLWFFPIEIDLPTQARYTHQSSDFFLSVIKLYTALLQNTSVPRNILRDAQSRGKF